MPTAFIDKYDDIDIEHIKPLLRIVVAYTYVPEGWKYYSAIDYYRGKIYWD